MKSLSRLENESLTKYANRLAEVYNSSNTKSSKKDKGQFFTPSRVATFMAEMSSTSKESISILDPGAGIGILSAAITEVWVSEIPNHMIHFNGDKFLKLN